MCFSAQASFTASGLLALIGIAALIKARHHRSLMLFAATPFLFAIQQFCEGIIWTTSLHNSHGYLHSVATHFYLICAYLVWPLWTPISIVCIEKISWRKMACYSALFAGLCFVLYTITQMVQAGFWARIDGGHISYPYYGSSFSISLASFLYLYANGTPTLTSSMRYMWLLLGAQAGSLFFTAYRYPVHITSLWCFFAALLSSIVLLIVSTEVNKNHARKK